jgi:murein DD-endopeptidase MepM/ murein hydrolase activator NlpD
MFGRLTLPTVLALSACVPAGCTLESAPASETLTAARAEVPKRGEDVFLPPLTRVVAGSVPRGATLATLFESHDLDAVAHPLIDAITDVFDPRRLRVDNAYRLLFGLDDGALETFEYHIDDDAFLHVKRAESGFEAQLVPYRQARLEQVLEADIDAANNSISAALDAQGKGVLLAVALAEVLSGEIDFNNDLRRGDRFSLLYEEVFREERFGGDGDEDLSFSRYGDVLAAEFINDGRRLQAFRFHVPGEPEAQYFDGDGRSMKRLFLRSPFRFEPRITSRFSYRRVHPILGGVRPHLGVDYGAPTGTPIVAVATGTVVSAGRSGGSGNMIRLRHTNGYETYYLHLSRFASSVRSGARVFQGQEIGYVGSTGLSTGPHLDYRMRKNGVFVNPLIEHRNLPPGDPVPQEHMRAFRSVRDAALVRLGSTPPMPPSIAAN